jgi:hypothetical protein
LADWAPQKLAELWYGVDVSATNSTRRLLPPLGLVSKLNCLTPLSGPCTTWLPRSTLRPMCNQAATLHSQTSAQLDCHAPLSDQWAIKLTRSTSQTSAHPDCHAPLSDQWAIRLTLSTLAKTRTATRALWEPRRLIRSSRPTEIFQPQQQGFFSVHAQLQLLGKIVRLLIHKT